MRPSDRRNRIESLRRRVKLLDRRLAEWNEDRDPAPTRRELAAVKWAVRVLEAAEAEGLMARLRDKGYDV